MSWTALRDHAVEAEQQALAGELADPALADRQVDDVRRVARGERVVEVVLERGLVVFPLDLDARIGRLEAGDRVLDVLVEGRRQVERPEADLGARLDARDDGFGRIRRERRSALADAAADALRLGRGRGAADGGRGRGGGRRALGDGDAAVQQALTTSAKQRCQGDGIGAFLMLGFAPFDA